MNDSGYGRWWENYLVRYFMPSIAGTAIVSWLVNVGPESLRSILFFGSAPPSLDAPTLTLLILYGNLFCYIASYPILCFHATRVTDFDQYSWVKRGIDGNISTVIFGICIFFVSSFMAGQSRVCISFIIVIIYVFLQLFRIYESLSEAEIDGYRDRPSSLAYTYLITLSKRRGVVSRITTSNESPNARSIGAEDEASTLKSTKQIESETRWQKEFVDSYRHMREHGNSSFIFFLELCLAAVCYGIISLEGYCAAEILSMVGVAFAIWSLPASFVHFLGQHLERRYSLYDDKFKTP